MRAKSMALSCPQRVIIQPDSNTNSVIYNALRYNAYRDNLAATPGNRLEKLHADRSGQWSIRINDQYRLCFQWEDNNAHEVEIVDYHR